MSKFPYSALSSCRAMPLLTSRVTHVASVGATATELARSTAKVGCCLVQRACPKSGTLLHSLAGSSGPSTSRKCRQRHKNSRVTMARSAAPHAGGLNCLDSSQYRIFTFNVECTSSHSVEGAIIELAVVDVASGASWSSLVKPQFDKDTPSGMRTPHGITGRDLRHPDVPTFDQALRQMWDHITHHTQQQQQQQHQHQHQHQQQQQLQHDREAQVAPVLVAHAGNNLDFRMLAIAVLSEIHPRNPASTSHAIAAQMQEQLMVFDTLALARKLKLKDREGLPDLKQATLREHFLGSPPSVAHRALADAQELAALLPHLLTWAAAQTRTDMDEKILPRTFHSFCQQHSGKADELLDAMISAQAACEDVSAIFHPEGDNILTLSRSRADVLAEWNRRNPFLGAGSSSDEPSTSSIDTTSRVNNSGDSSGKQEQGDDGTSLDEQTNQACLATGQKDSCDDSADASSSGNSEIGDQRVGTSTSLVRGRRRRKLQKVTC